MSELLKEKTSKRIKALRIQHKYTMEMLAEKINVSKSTIAKWENGYVENMRQESIMKLASVFNVSPTYIMGYDDTYEEREQVFTKLYAQLDENQRTLVDNLLETLTSKK